MQLYDCLKPAISQFFIYYTIKLILVYKKEYDMLINSRFQSDLIRFYTK